MERAVYPQEVHVGRKGSGEAAKTKPETGILRLESGNNRKGEREKDLISKNRGRKFFQIAEEG